MSVVSVRSLERDARFFQALENGHPVRAACAACGYARSSVYEWRQIDDAFAARWLRSIAMAVDLLEEEADRRGRDGTEEPVFFRGSSVGARRKYSDSLLLARLKALRPDAYRDGPAFQAQPQQVTIVVRDFINDPPALKTIDAVKADMADADPDKTDSHPDTLPLSGMSALAVGG
ncbi:MAG: hypothetical protein ACKVRO_19580 [Micropepsaceae bacterium]